MTTIRVPAGLAGGLLVLSLALIGCGGTTPAGTAPASSAPAGSVTAQAGAQFNDADVAFAQMMIPHHREAVEMADLAVDRAQNPEVKALAEQIRAAQEPEITQLTGFLTAWGAAVPAAGSMSGMDHGNMSGMSGMSGTPAIPGAMTPEQMEQLRTATGTGYDSMFLAMMIEHHRGAVDMAQGEVENGGNPDAKQLAEKIVADQNTEISRMQQLLTG
jgi:uncharacterized protein (DUF305 family)